MSKPNYCRLWSDGFRIEKSSRVCCWSLSLKSLKPFFYKRKLHCPILDKLLWICVVNRLSQYFGSRLPERNSKLYSMRKEILSPSRRTREIYSLCYYCTAPPPHQVTLCFQQKRQREHSVRFFKCCIYCSTHSTGRSRNPTVWNRVLKV